MRETRIMNEKFWRKAFISENGIRVQRINFYKRNGFTSAYEMAKKGYRLKAINNFVYDFEKTDKDYTYSTQFIGANSSNEWSGLSMIVS